MGLVLIEFDDEKGGGRTDSKSDGQADRVEAGCSGTEMRSLDPGVYAANYVPPTWNDPVYDHTTP